eukprot:Lithocolla_globosa_v1_NODE_10159_length_629_cov_2929.538328.p1 type:complete len:114 gc:universal NODE_10159_length_629_cov_2929.538328:561-220(-)
MTDVNAKQLERVRKRAGRTIANDKEFFTSQVSRRDKLCSNFFQKLAKKGSPLFPETKLSARRGKYLNQPFARTDRYRKSFMVAEISQFNQRSKKSRDREYEKFEKKSKSNGVR